MKQLTCEMCGSTDLIKQNGVFVCQTCGCKYSVEEARKMMIEGTVDVSGSTIKIDNTAQVQKSLENARRAKAKSDWDEVAKYYNMVEQNEPQNIEAIFYSSYAKVMQSLRSDPNTHKREYQFNIFGSSISIIDDNYSIEKSDELMPLIQNMSNDLTAMIETRFVYNGTTDHNDKSDTFLLFDYAEDRFIETIENIVKIDEKVYLYRILISHYTRRISAHFLFEKETRERYIKRLEQINKRMAEMDPTFKPEHVPKNGCYVATAVYGSYDCPQVWTLRRFRDYTLAKTWYGRAFIRTYYAISPILVKWFGHTNWFKRMWKGKLDRMVANLNASGVKDTPYEDKVW